MVDCWCWFFWRCLAASSYIPSSYYGSSEVTASNHGAKVTPFSGPWSRIPMPAFGGGPLSRRAVPGPRSPGHGPQWSCGYISWCRGWEFGTERVAEPTLVGRAQCPKPGASSDRQRPCLAWPSLRANPSPRMSQEPGTRSQAQSKSIHQRGGLESNYTTARPPAAHAIKFQDVRD